MEEPSHLNLTLYADSTFHETLEEVEDTYEYSGVWRGSVAEDSVFTLYIPVENAARTTYVPQWSFLVNNGTISWENQVR
jgi:hypothetical protein